MKNDKKDVSKKREITKTVIDSLITMLALAKKTKHKDGLVLKKIEDYCKLYCMRVLDYVKESTITSHLVNWDFKNWDFSNAEFYAEFSKRKDVARRKMIIAYTMECLTSNKVITEIDLKNYIEANADMRYIGLDTANRASISGTFGNLRDNGTAHLTKQANGNYLLNK